MKKSTKILLAGLIPVVLFATANIATNRARAERIAPEVEKLSAALDLATIRVVELRGPQAGAVQVFKNDNDRNKDNALFQSRSIVPSADWLRRSGDTLIVDRTASMHVVLPAVETVIRNDSAEGVSDYRP